jgi:hypothetical protein
MAKARKGKPRSTPQEPKPRPADAAAAAPEASARGSRWSRGGRAGLVALALIVPYWFAAQEQAAQVNRNISGVDQLAYLRYYAMRMRKTDYQYVTDRNRMPVYPFLQSLFYNLDQSEDENWQRGKQVNIVLSVILLVGIYLIATRYFPPHHTLNLVVVTAFTVFVFKAGYYQCELLFYFLSLCCFLLMAKLLVQPSWKWAILTGVMLGVTHLTKASILPGMLLFVGFFGLKIIGTLIRTWRRPSAETAGRRAIGGQLLTVGCVLLCFLIVVFPYLRTSKQKFGRYFYNVNSTFYIWYNSWQEARRGTKAHGDRDGWPHLPADQIPSMGKYLRDHTTAQIMQRLSDGAKVVLQNCAQSYGYHRYVIGYAAFALLAAGIGFRRSLKDAARYGLLIGFAAAYVGSYFVLYAFYAPIASGNRLTLGLFLPLMFSLSAVAVRFGRELRIPLRRWRVSLLTAFNVLLTPLLAYDVYVILTQRITAVYGGV